MTTDSERRKKMVAKRKAKGLCPKCGGERADKTKQNCESCRSRYRAEYKKKSERKKNGQHGEHCECGRGRKVYGCGPGLMNACIQCLEQDGVTEAQFAIIQTIRASESPPSVYAIAMECEVSVDAAAHSISRLVRKGVLGKRTTEQFGGHKELAYAETAEYFVTRGH